MKHLLLLHRLLSIHHEDRCVRTKLFAEQTLELRLVIMESAPRRAMARHHAQTSLPSRWDANYLWADNDPA